jgi:hypothetical protein
MSTTQLVAELLVIGVGACVWVALFVAAAFGYRVEYDAAAIEPALLVVLLGGIAYVLGIAVDRLAYALFRRIEEKVERQVARSRTGAATPGLGAELADAKQMEYYVLTRSEVLGGKIQYNRSRLRICRAWVVNAFATSVGFVVWSLRAGSLSFGSSLVIAGAIITLCLLVLWATLALLRDHHTNVMESYLFLKGSDGISTQR